MANHPQVYVCVLFSIIWFMVCGLFCLPDLSIASLGLVYQLFGRLPKYGPYLDPGPSSPAVSVPAAVTCLSADHQMETWNHQDWSYLQHITFLNIQPV